jgi:uncharacterized protein (TIGR04255 family)
METDPLLPSFVRPPLDEVAADLQFSPLPIKAADIGAFRSLIADEYPNSTDVPPLPPSFETEGISFIPPFALNLGGGLLPRSWFISSDDEHVVQLQADRLIINWRLRPNGGAYPRYPEVRQRLVAAHEALTVFVHQHGYPDVMPNQCDLSYFNKIPLPPGAEWGEIHRLLKGITLNSSLPEGEQFSDCHLVLRRLIRDHNENAFRRLHVECRPIQVGIDQKAWALNITVKGRPAEPNLAAALNFFDTAHVEIVRCFAAITTVEMHRQWERLT